jgi:selenocysteine-specific elongation factor
LAIALQEAGESGIESASLPIRLGAPPAALAVLLEQEGTLQISGRVYATDAAASLAARLVRLVDEAHRARPLEPGVSLQEVRSRLGAPPELVDFVLARAVEQGSIETDGGVIRAAGWSPRLTREQRDRVQAIENALRDAAHEPPSVGELVARFGADAADLLRVLERDGRVVPVEPERFYATESVSTLIDRLRTGMITKREYAPAELRELLGFSRKFLIPFLEYCDRRGLTVRGASGRFWHGT